MDTVTIINAILVYQNMKKIMQWVNHVDVLCPGNMKKYYKTTGHIIQLHVSECYCTSISPYIRRISVVKDNISTFHVIEINRLIRTFIFSKKKNIQINKMLLFQQVNVFISRARVDDRNGKLFQERLLFPDYPKRYLFQSREVNARCEANILNDFRRKVAKGSRWRINVSHELVPWRKKDYFRPGGCTEIYNKTAPVRLELPLCSRPFTVHDLRAQIMPVKFLRVGFSAPRELYSIVIPVNERYTYVNHEWFSRLFRISIDLYRNRQAGT